MKSHKRKLRLEARVKKWEELRKVDRSGRFERANQKPGSLKK